MNLEPFFFKTVPPFKVHYFEQGVTIVVAAYKQRLTSNTKTLDLDFLVKFYP